MQILEACLAIELLLCGIVSLLSVYLELHIVLILSFLLLLVILKQLLLLLLLLLLILILTIIEMMSEFILQG